MDNKEEKPLYTPSEDKNSPSQNQIADRRGSMPLGVESSSSDDSESSVASYCHRNRISTEPVSRDPQKLEFSSADPTHVPADEMIPFHSQKIVTSALLSTFIVPLCSSNNATTWLDPKSSRESSFIPRFVSPSLPRHSLSILSSQNSLPPPHYESMAPKADRTISLQSPSYVPRISTRYISPLENHNKAPSETKIFQDLLSLPLFSSDPLVSSSSPAFNQRSAQDKQKKPNISVLPKLKKYLFERTQSLQFPSYNYSDESTTHGTSSEPEKQSTDHSSPSHTPASPQQLSFSLKPYKSLLASSCQQQPSSSSKCQFLPHNPPEYDYLGAPLTLPHKSNSATAESFEFKGIKRASPRSVPTHLNSSRYLFHRSVANLKNNPKSLPASQEFLLTLSPKQSSLYNAIKENSCSAPIYLSNKHAESYLSTVPPYLLVQEAANLGLSAEKATKQPLTAAPTETGILSLQHQPFAKP